MADTRLPALIEYVPEPADALHPGIGRHVLAGMAVMLLFFGGFASWAALARLDSAALAPGVVAVESGRKTVQHLEGGIVARLLVSEGRSVAAGEPLILLDQTQAQATLEELRAAWLASAASAALLRAERDGRSQIAWPRWPDWADSTPQLASVTAGETKAFDARQREMVAQSELLRSKIAQSAEEITGIEGEMESLTDQLRLIEEEIADMSQLLKKGLIDKPRVLALRRRKSELAGSFERNRAQLSRARHEIAEFEIRIAELKTARASDAAGRLQEIERELRQLEGRLFAAGEVFARTIIRAPLTGRVVALKVHTIGGVIGSGEPLMDIVPDDERLVVEVRLNPSDIDVVEPGQVAELRFNAFQDRESAPIMGRLISISADRLTEEESGRAYYLGRIALSAESTRMLDSREIVPGMQADAIILTGEGTLLDYLLRPIERTFRHALREG
ncbi:MAG TPA: HlyD family type I secretion periplasmic adaptor subunit [Alphaproteobacteria bacterium]|nr:HlyD family type I secretion periplasmic adaptor subunit [Alphaproteobacteria bacterium]